MMFRSKKTNRFRAKRFVRKTYSNPYFSRSNKIDQKKYLYGLAAVAICLIIIPIGLFSNPSFDIKMVSITGVKQLLKPDLEQHINEYLLKRRALVFHNTNRFLFSKKKLEEHLNTYYHFESIQMKQSKQTLSINLKERTSQFIWKTASNIYLADLEGVIIRQINDTEQIQLPKMVDKNSVPVEIGKSVLAKDAVQNIFLFDEGLKKQGISVSDIQIDRLAGKWIGALTSSGYMILFDATGDIEDQLNRLALLFKNTLKDIPKLQYIDLRFGDHVYYK